MTDPLVLRLPQPPTMEQATLEKLVRYWQREMRLTGWRVRAFIDTAIGAQGRAYWEVKCGDATILINPANCHDPVEKVVIHELMHLHLAWLGDPKPKSRLEMDVEWAVDSAAWAIYRAKHGLSVLDPLPDVFPITIPPDHD